MFFRFAGWFFLVVLIGACARENEVNRSPVQVELKNGGECLRHFGSELSRFFDGRMSQVEVEIFWGCSVDAIREFQRLTAGESGGDSYTPQAIRRFLYRHRFLEQPLSDDLLAAVMDLKAVFLAGTPQVVTRDELTRLQDLLMEIKGAALDINPHLDIVFHRRSATDAEVRQASTALKRTSLRLAVWLDRNQRSYSITQLTGFVAALKAWVKPGSEGQENFSKLEKAVSTLGPSKKILVGGDGDLIQGDAWLPLWTGVGRVLSIYLELRHSFGEDLNSGLIRGLLPDALDELASCIDEALKRRTEKKLPLADWRELFVRIESAGLLRDPFTSENISNAFSWLVSRGMGESPTSDSITSTTVRRLRKVTENWQDLLDRTNGGARGDPGVGARFQSVLDASVPMEWDSDGRLVHVRKGATSWLASNKRRMVWPFVILDWIRESYVGARPTLTEDDLNLAVSEILPMLQKFGWLTTTKPTIGKRLLREADLFTLASRGDFELDLGEATRYLAFVASGLRTSEVWLDDVKANCPDLLSDCVRQAAVRPGSKALDPFPHLKQRVTSQPVEEFVKYMRQAEETILNHSVSGTYGKGDMLQVLQLFQYVEAFLQNYDADFNETIELPEASEAYRKYGPTLSRLLSKNGLPPDDVLAFFTFMMKYGDTPFSMFGGQIRFNHWRWHRKDWSFSADRATLMSILNQLSKL